MEAKVEAVERMAKVAFEAIIGIAGEEAMDGDETFDICDRLQALLDEHYAN